jgi:hypothetical protein
MLQGVLSHGSSPRQVDDTGKSRKFAAGFSLATSASNPRARRRRQGGR